MIDYHPFELDIGARSITSAINQFDGGGKVSGASA